MVGTNRGEGRFTIQDVLRGVENAQRPRGKQREVQRGAVEMNVDGRIHEEEHGKYMSK